MSPFGKMAYLAMKLNVTVIVLATLVAISHTVPKEYQKRNNTVISNNRTGPFIIRPHIVGGIRATISEFPFLISIRVTLLHHCGGSLLTYRLVLTAAHCLPPEKFWDTITLVAGATSIYDKYYQERKLLGVKIHNGYDEKTSVHDIALIAVNPKFEHTPKVSLVKIPTKKLSSLDPYKGDTVTVLGWGATKFKGSYSNTLLKVNLKLISQRDCRKRYSYMQPLYMFYCTAGGEKDACQGDSGGPLMHKGEQIGIVSYGMYCADGWPGAYTRLDQYLEWINYSYTGSYSHKLNGLRTWILMWIIFYFF